MQAPLHVSLLTPSLAASAAAVGMLTLAAGLAYRRIWQRVRTDGVTPTGFGVLLAPVMLSAALFSGAPWNLTASLGIVTLATAIYWTDDLVHLSARLRLLVSFLAGAGIGLAYLFDEGLSPLMLVGAMLVAGGICVVLTNMVNFCDGADLNLTSFIVLTAMLILLFTPHDQHWTPVAVGALAFALPFAIMNSRPRTIYLGDAGSFAFAGLLTAMAVAFLQSFGNIAPEAAIPAALPMLDVAYVFAVRVIEKHDLLTRNYLHLYQRLNRRYAGFGYLLPQFVNVGLCLGIAALLEATGLGRIVSVIVAMILVTPPFYFLCRRLFLAGPPEGPLYEKNR
jgi:UDP-N-acetylmuramyl pentapeptide phosphotransferase/UDP-N-acetylglucosamine-1-phosphate transferase